MKLPLPMAVLLASGCIAAPAADAVEHATYHSAGGLTALIADGQEFPLRGELVASFEGGVRATLQPHDQHAAVTREGRDLHWQGVAVFPNAAQARFDAAWTESDAGVALAASATSGGPAAPGAPAPRLPLPVESLDYVLDLPRATFAGWSVAPGNLPLPAVQPADPVFFHETVDRLVFTDAQRNWRLTVALDQPREVTLTDVWSEADARVYRVRIRLGGGLWPADETWKLGLTLKLEGAAHAAAARVTVNPAAPRYAFDGFGGNYCFNTDTPVADYMLKNLRQAWARFEFKAQVWDRERATKPGPALIRDFELMQRVQRTGLTWILSAWRLPERFYAEANRQPPYTFGRRIAPDRWPEFLDLLGSYLLYLKKNYDAEPDYFSFNEPDLGVNVGFTPEAHRDAIKRIGAHLASLGLKTKLLLGDAANPQGSHRYVLPAAADPEAMRYVGAVSFHSWNSGTPAQYAAWGDVGAWLARPLVVAEAGTDPGAWRNRMFDSYAYGLGEMRQYQELLRDARAQAFIYWQFTEDYGLVHFGSDRQVEPTGRFWLMKHFTNLTPQQGQVVASASDQPDVLVSAFAKGEALTVHLLNTGPARDVTLAGLPAATWKVVTTTETAGWDEQELTAADRAKPLHVPARSLTTLVRKP